MEGIKPNETCNLKRKHPFIKNAKKCGVNVNKNF